MILPALTEATSPLFRSIKYSLFPPVGLATLAAYLACSGSWSRCADTMHLHVNTVRYRIERIEAMTGRDLRRLDDQVDLLLALRLANSTHE